MTNLDGRDAVRIEFQSQNDRDRFHDELGAFAIHNVLPWNTTKGLVWYNEYRSSDEYNKIVQIVNSINADTVIEKCQFDFRKGAVVK